MRKSKKTTFSLKGRVEVWYRKETVNSTMSRFHTPFFYGEYGYVRCWSLPHQQSSYERILPQSIFRDKVTVVGKEETENSTGRRLHRVIAYMNIVWQQSATSKMAKSNFEARKKMAKLDIPRAFKQSTSKSDVDYILRKTKSSNVLTTLLMII